MVEASASGFLEEEPLLAPLLRDIPSGLINPKTATRKAGTRRMATAKREQCERSIDQENRRRTDEMKDHDTSEGRGDNILCYCPLEDGSGG